MSVCTGCHTQFKEVVKICEYCGRDIPKVKRKDYWDVDYKYRPYENVTRVIGRKRKLMRRVKQ